MIPVKEPVGLTAVTSTDRPKSVHNRWLIEVFGGVFKLSRWILDISVGVGAFVIGPSQISSLFSQNKMKKRAGLVSTRRVWVYWCFTSHATIFQSYMWRHRCAGWLKKKLYLRLGSQRYRHFAGILNVYACPSYTDTGPPFLYDDSDKPPHLVAIYDTLWIRRTNSWCQIRLLTIMEYWTNKYRNHLF